MGKKNKQKGKMVVSESIDLETFNKNETRKQQEAEFACRPNAGKSNQTQETTKQTSSSTSTAVHHMPSMGGQVNSCQARLNKTDAPSSDIDLPVFYSFDNKLIEAYCAANHNLNLPQSSAVVVDILEPDELYHFSKRLLKELTFVLNLEFVKFWAQITKNDQVILFMDDFLQNVHKYNDIHKLLLQTEGHKIINSNQRQLTDVDREVKSAFQKILGIVLKIFYRMSQISEDGLKENDDEQKYSIGYYQELVYNNWLFDMAKLFDIAAVYGESNSDVVRQLITNVFNNDKRYVEDFKESVDVIINMFKKSFGTALKVNEMIAGNEVFQKSREEQDLIIEDLLLDFIDLMNNVELITSYFPDQMLETIRNTSMLLFMANTYCLMHRHANKWLKQSEAQNKLDAIRKTLKKLAYTNCIQILEKAILNNIGEHSKNYAIVQDRIGRSLNQFILGTTGNVELSKDVLHKNNNFISDSAKAGNNFIKKILKTQDLLGKINQFEERFMDKDEKQFLSMILNSIQKGNQVQVVKNKKLSQTMAKSAANIDDETSQLTMQDKENIKSIMDMFSGQFRNERVRDVYISNNKDFEKTLDMFLTGNLPEEKKELEVIITEKKKQEPLAEQIDTVDKQPVKSAMPQSKEELQAYVMDKYRDVLFGGKKKTAFEINHERAMELREQEERDDEMQVKKKILSLAAEMAYDDDFEESQVQLKHKKQPTASSNNNANQRQKTAAKNVEEEDKDQDDDDEDLVDVTAAFVEAQAADVKESTQDYLFEDDKKSKMRRQQLLEQHKKEQQKDNNNNNNNQDGGNRNNNQKNQNNNNNKGGQGGQSKKKQQHQTKDQQRDARIKDRKKRDKDEYDERQQHADRFDNPPSRGRGNRGNDRGGRGGYRDDYQREKIDVDRAYTTKNPLHNENLENDYTQEARYEERKVTNNNNSQSDNRRKNYQDRDDQSEGGQSSRGNNRGGRGRGGNNRGRGNNQNKRGGAHNQRSQAAKKQAAYQQA